MELVFLSLDEILEIHEQPIERYGGSQGLRDAAGLESAVATPQATFGGEFLHPSIPAMAAAYLFHLCQNHPFVDGKSWSSWSYPSPQAGWRSSNCSPCSRLVVGLWQGNDDHPGTWRGCWKPQFLGSHTFCISSLQAFFRDAVPILYRAPLRVNT